MQLVERGADASGELVDAEHEGASGLAERAKSGLGEATETLCDGAAETVERASEGAARAAERTREGVAAAAERTKRGAAAAAEQTKASAAKAAEHTKAGVAKAAEHTKAGAAKAAERAKGGASLAADKMSETAKDGLRRAGELGGCAQEAVWEGWSKLSDDERQQLGLETNRTSLDLSEQSEQRQLAFYGALFAMSSIDGEIERDEIFAVFEVLESDDLSEEARQKLRSFIVEPPELEEALSMLVGADETLRYAAMINLVEVVCADDLVTDNEEKGLALAQQKLGVSDEERAEIENFVDKMRQVRDRGVDDDKAAETIQSAVAGLAGVGVPVAAISVSGSVAGLSAAGITSGLAALGLGLGMAPGIGAAVFIGTVTYLGARRALGTKRRRRKEAIRAERERRAQRVVENLQDTIEHLTTRVAELRASAETAEANREAIEKLTGRIQKLKKVLARQEDDE